MKLNFTYRQRKARQDGETDGTVVDLGAATLIGHGWKRDCYIHPGWRDRLTTLRFDRRAGTEFNRREWKAYGLVGTVLGPFVPRYHGPIQTSHGEGLEVDLIRDAQGMPSQQLRAWIHRSPPEEGEKLLTQFHALFDLIASRNVWLFDLNMSNYVVQDTEDGTARIWLIDLKRVADPKEIFQVTAWTQGQKRRKLARRIARFHAKFEADRNTEPPRS